jgi:ligand-binding sensor domain-containing protein
MKSSFDWKSGKKNNSKSIGIFLLSVIAFAQLIADESALIERLKFYAPFEKVNASDGLSNLTVTSILRDSRGLVWIGTLDGLNLYDGSSCHVFRHRPGDPNSISSVSIWSLSEDEEGKIWIATGNGLNCYNPKTGMFRSYNHDRYDDSSISSDIVRVVHVDSKNRLWVGTDGKGLNLFDPATNKFKRFPHDGLSDSSISGSNVWTVYEDSEGRIWVGTTQGGLAYWNDLNETFETIIAVPADAPGSADGAIMSFSEIEQGLYWYGTLGAGLFELRLKDRNSRKLDESAFSGNDFGDAVKGITKDPTGHIWLATHEGLLLVSPDREGSLLLQPLEGDTVGLSTHQVWSIHCDKNGNIWTGHYNGGVNWLSLKDMGFRTIRKSSLVNHSLSDNKVLSFAEGPEGTIYIGTDGAGLNISNLSFGSFDVVNVEPLDQSKENLAILSMQFDSKGRLWMGTWGGGLVAYDPKSGDFAHYWDNPERPNQWVNNPYVWSIIVDELDNVWAATMGGGLNHLNTQTGEVTVFQHNEADANSLSNNNVWSLFMDSQKRLWVGTQDGINLLNEDKKSFTIFKKDPSNPSGLSNTWIKCINQDLEGHLWFGTDGGGLNRLDETSGNFLKVNSENGLNSSVIQSIQVDDANRLWVSSNYGISSISIQSDDSSSIVQNYDSTSGLQGNQFAIGSGITLSDGRIAFGGLNGFSVFDPNSVRPVNDDSRLHITGFWTTEELLESDDDLNSDQSFRDIGSSKTLSFSQNDFMIQFVPVVMFSTQAPATQYRLEGYEQSWTTTDRSERRVRYANIPPGNYTFELALKSEETTPPRIIDTLEIRILRPWWMEWWAILGFVASILTLLFGIYFGSLSMLQRQKKLLKLKVQQRTAEIQKQASEIDAQNRELSEKNIKLLRLDQEKDFLLSAVSHDLRDPPSHKSPGWWISWSKMQKTWIRI